MQMGDRSVRHENKPGSASQYVALSSCTTERGAPYHYNNGKNASLVYKSSDISEHRHTVYLSALLTLSLSKRCVSCVLRVAAGLQTSRATLASRVKLTQI